MVEPEQIERVKFLLGRGRLSHRKIAQEVGISRQTVANIAAGTHAPKWGRRRRIEDSVEANGHASVASRCPECGALVYMPCRHCETVELTERLRADRRVGGTSVSRR